MKFKIYDLKRFINYNNKPKRNVLYKIGYDKFSFKKFIRYAKNYISSDENKRKIKDVARAIKNLFR